MDNELYHYGVKGQKWGVRHDRRSSRSYIIKPKKSAATVSRLASSTGSTLKRGKQMAVTSFKTRRSNKKVSEVASGKASEKDITKLSNDELIAATKRLQLENQYKQALRDSKPAKERNSMVSDAISVGLSNGLKTSATKFVANSSYYLIAKAFNNVMKDNFGSFATGGSDAIDPGYIIKNNNSNG